MAGALPREQGNRTGQNRHESRTACDGRQNNMGPLLHAPQKPAQIKPRIGRSRQAALKRAADAAATLQKSMPT